MQNHQAEFRPQEIANLLWALAKLVEREVLTPEQASEAVTALLPQVQNHQAEFRPQEIANLLWALAKLVEREVLTPGAGQRGGDGAVATGAEPLGRIYTSRHRQPAVCAGETSGA